MPPPPTERLRFRTWATGDHSLALGLWGDPEVTALIGGPLDTEQVQAKLADEVALQEQHGVQYWPIFLDGGEHAGCCGLRPYDLERGIYELGFHLVRRHWGQGLASEAARAVIPYAFEVVGAETLFAGHHPENATSRRLLEKLGFSYSHTELFEATGLDHPSYFLSSSHPR